MLGSNCHGETESLRPAGVPHITEGVEAYRHALARPAVWWW